MEIYVINPDICYVCLRILSLVFYVHELIRDGREEDRVEKINRNLPAIISMDVMPQFIMCCLVFP